MSYYEYIPFRSSSFVTCRSRKRLLKGAKPSKKASVETVTNNEIRIANDKAIKKANTLQFEKPKTAFAGALRSNLIRMAMS